MTTAAQLERLLPVGQCARRLNVSPQRVRQLIDEGALPAVRGAYAVRLVDREVLEKFARERQEKNRGSTGR